MTRMHCYDAACVLQEMTQPPAYAKLHACIELRLIFTRRAEGVRPAQARAPAAALIQSQEAAPVAGRKPFAADDFECGHSSLVLKAGQSTRCILATSFGVRRRVPIRMHARKGAWNVAKCRRV